jgi:hypothetical protein
MTMNPRALKDEAFRAVSENAKGDTAYSFAFGYLADAVRQGGTYMEMRAVVLGLERGIDWVNENDLRKTV